MAAGGHPHHMPANLGLACALRDRFAATAHHADGLIYVRDELLHLSVALIVIHERRSYLEGCHNVSLCHLERLLSKLRSGWPGSRRAIRLACAVTTARNAMSKAAAVGGIGCHRACARPPRAASWSPRLLTPAAANVSETMCSTASVGI